MKRRTLLTPVAAALLGAPMLPRAAIDPRDFNEAIDRAGRQRMLSQRMAKCWLAMGQSTVPEQALRTKNASIARFESQLNDLKGFAPNPDIRGVYVELEKAFAEYKALLTTTPARAQAERVLQQAGRVLALAHQGTGMLEAVAGKPVAQLVNVSGRQRMLSQRMAAFFYSASWDVQGNNARAELAKAREEFLAAHERLKSAPQATALIRQELDMAAAQFTFFDSALRRLADNDRSPQALTNVFTTSERILEVMESVTGRYARLV